MNGIRLLESPIQPYAWGSRTALAELQGRPAPTPEPEAELWVGAHPAAPSQVRTADGLVPLAEWIARDPAAMLGEAVAARHGELPFLLKVLAVAQPLSLQAHPDADRARRGFQREEAAGIPRDAAGRNYRDPNPKLELACALGPFETLLGFRAPAEILARAEALGVAELASALSPLRASPDALGWRRSFEALLGLAPAERAPLLDRVAEAASARAADDPSWAWIPRLAEAHPGDVGALAPLFLGFQDWKAGEGGLVAPGVLHAHLTGVAVEVMTNSDNVVRAGLTPKHVDVPELLELLDFAPPTARPFPAGPAGVERTLEGGGDAFQLSELRPEGAPVPRPAGVALLLCTAGAVRARGGDGASQADLASGQAAFVPHAAGPWQLEGRGQAWVVGVPQGEGGG